jgi:hypothetical protein
MTSGLTRQRFSQSPVQILLVITALQVLICLFTDGFTLSFDEAIWHYIGRNWFRHGMVPYSGGIDNKSPLIFLIYGISDTLFGVNYWFPRILGTIVESTGIYFLYRIANKFAGKRAGIFAMSIYGLSLLWRSTDGKYPSLTETWSVTLLIISFYKYFFAKKQKDYFFSGLISGLSLGFRITSLSGITAIVISCLRKNKSQAVFFFAGLSLSIGALMLIALMMGIHPSDYFNLGIIENFGSGSITDRSVDWRLESFVNGFFYSELLLFYAPLLAYFFIKPKNTTIILWLILEFVGINFIGMYARPHFKNLLPAMSLLSALSINYFIETYAVQTKYMLLIIWILFFPKLIEPFVSFKHLLFPPRVNPSISCNAPFPHPDDLARKKMGTWIKENTSENTTVFVSGYGAQVQAYSERISPTRYFNFTQTRDAMISIKQELSANKPGMIVVPVFAEYSGSMNPEIEAFIEGLISTEYLSEGCRFGYTVYRRK